jgi:O-antigen/teichoic acid export membrane protein
LVFKKIKQLKNHQGFMKYFKNTSWLFAEKILRMVMGLFVGVWVARYLGAEKFGMLSYAQAFVGLFSAIATLGLNGIVIRELVKYPEKESELLGTAFILKLFGAVLTLFILYIAIQFTSNDSLTNSLIFIIASATIFQAFNVIDFYFQAKVMSKYVVFANSVSLLLSSILKIVLILNQAPLIYFAFIVLFDSIVLAIGYIYWYFKIKREFFIKKINFSFDLAKSLLKDSWPLILSGIVISIYMKIDQVMIKEMLDSEAVGNYAVAVRLSEIWYFIPMVITLSLFPAIVNAKKISEELYYKRLQKLYDLMVWIAISIAIPITFLSDWIVNLLYGIQYSESADVLKVHIWAGVFVFLGVASGKWFLSENLQKLAFYRTLFGAIINIILNFIMIPKYGIIGASIATLISQMVASYLFNILNSITRNTFIMQTKTIFIWRYIYAG